MFEPTGRGFAAYDFAAMRLVQNTGVGKWFPIVSQSGVHITTERPKDTISKRISKSVVKVKIYLNISNVKLHAMFFEGIFFLLLILKIN